MGKNKQRSGVGRSLIKDRFGQKNRTAGDSFLHTSELSDGFEWGRLNLQSVTEQNNLDDFLATAELAGTEFTAEKLNVKFVPRDSGGLPRGEDLLAIQGLHKQHENLLRIPRRPQWSSEMSASELDQKERQAFLEWRRSLAFLQEDERIVMTPYEKNLDFWRQLWRVIERSDIVVQIVDARNPLLFYCADLETYVGEVEPSKVCLLLANKADHLSEEQRQLWADYFTEKGIRLAFWSAVEESLRQEQEDKLEKQNAPTDQDCQTEEGVGEGSDCDTDTGDGSDDTEECNTESVNDIHVDGENDHMSGSSCDHDNNMDNKNELSPGEKVLEEITAKKEEHKDENAENQSGSAIDSACDVIKESCSCEVTLTQSADSTAGTLVRNTSQMYTGPELLQMLKGLHTGRKAHKGLVTVGMVGYPNVGKSSTINAILKMKKVPVSATPGRTKHFQTLYVDPELMLCDCPGLVFPSFVTTKADLVVSGILPIDQMRDYIPPSQLLCERLPRWVLETTYGINLPAPGEGEDPHRPPTAYELLNTYGAMRGYMTYRAVPDMPRSSRYLLKDYVNGKLLYCHPPPDVDSEAFNKFEERRPVKAGPTGSGDMPGSSDNTQPLPPSKIDADFFRKEFSTVHTKTNRQ
ncbi:large subunit GTPase 1 homolog isoform X2 [Dreissena polymorpha]|uniref:large subunit GTPase 1 homolog isoform X2 n=1 Tax=Dreissena polymorpha TaxID=45954 RepID=UPI002263D7F5|nr:large subunit GTPase 1 homolog isoform X2 [Dreissena polymorpha]